jgi:hypothetical protein
VGVLEEVFRGKFIDGLQRAYRRHKLSFGGATASLHEPKAFAAFLRTLHRQRWVAYVKPAMAGPTSVLRYLGRYTHRVAISNHRLVSFDGQRVTFRWKDYKRGNKQRLMTLDAAEFLRRYVQHILPQGFVRIRQFGFLANRYRSKSLNLIRGLLLADAKPSPSPVPATATWRCPSCGHAMVIGRKLSIQELIYRCSYPDTS